MTEKVVSNHNPLPDWIELSKNGAKVHICFNTDEPEGAFDRVEEALVIRQFAITALLKHTNPLTDNKIKKIVGV